MHILVDGDALPAVIREILFRAVARVRIPLLLVANRRLKVPASPHITTLIVPSGSNVADDRIVELAQAGDLVITADIPLADRVVSKGCLALDPRGTLLDQENIKERLSLRDFLDELRDGGMVTGGPPALAQKDSQRFANQLDRLLARRG